MVTAFGQALEPVSLQDSGISEVLSKPFTQSVLFDAAHKVMGKTGRSHGINIPVFEKYKSEDFSGARVLLVEDNKLNQEVAKELLESVGISLAIAENGRESLEMVKLESFDIVLMDMQMPVMDGLTACQELRKEYSSEDLPILAMTANAMEKDVKACLESGMNDHISKPIDPEYLYKKIKEYLPKKLQLQLQGTA